MKPHLFVIGLNVFNAVSVEEVDATVSALKELDLYRLPYENCHIKFPFTYVATCKHIRPGYEQYFDTALDGKVRWKEPDFWFLAKLESGEVSVMYEGSKLEWGKAHLAVSDDDKRPDICLMIKDLLITLLATENAVKTTSKNKLANLGIGKSRYVYTTTISLPAGLSGNKSAGSGPAKCPHLRRGHIRRQRHGPANALIKRIWIAPMLIHADQEFTRTRTSYNVSMGKENVES